MQSIPQITCSLGLGLVYSLDYSYDPKGGISMKLYFVREDGNVISYTPPTPMQKVFIQVGTASFTLYPIRAGVEMAQGRRIMWVEFVDDTFRLESYLIALPGRGCGTNIITLGTPVDNRTPAQKVAAAIDKTAQQIKELTQFPDYEYTFNDFLAVLRTKFTVIVSAAYDGTITQAFEGTFAEVLSNWCNYYNLSYFFESGFLKIFSPAFMNIIFPILPSDALSYETEVDITSTYGKTVCNWFQQDGGEYPLSQTSDGSGPIEKTEITLWPVGHEFGLTQNNLDLNQVAASMYGMNYWFLYNYYKGTTTDQCGWTPIDSSYYSSLSAGTSIQTAGTRAVAISPGVMEQKFEAYQQYGQNVAGRWYLSDRIEDISVDKTYSWFSEAQGPITNFSGMGSRAISVDFLTPPGGGGGTIDGTYINPSFSGINYAGNRIVYRDDYDTQIAANFQLPPAVSNLVNTTYESLFNVGGAEAMDFSKISTAYHGAEITAYNSNLTIPQDITSTFGNVGGTYTGFLPRYDSLPIVGIRTADYVSLNASTSEPGGVTIVKGNSGPNVVTNTSVLKTVQQGAYTIYYDKYSKCASASTPDFYFGFDFDVRQVSTDNQVGITFTKPSKNTYNLQRDYGYINNLVANPLLPTLAQARTFPTRRMSFALNRFYEVPFYFLSNGLVGMNVSFNDNGIIANYSFSNEVLRVPDRTSDFEKLAQNMRNTWTRTYRPKELLT